MQLSMGQSLILRQQLQQRLVVTMPQINWSLVDAFAEDAQRGFSFPLTMKRARVIGLDALSHEEFLKYIDARNELFRFAYTRGRNQDGRESGYYKIPLIRNFSVEIADIRIRITKAEYMRAVAVLDNVGMMERIARAVPYHELLTTVRDHLQSEYGVSHQDVVLVGVDRGGRLPAIILSKALANSDLHFLKVDQGDGLLDEDRLVQFVQDQTFQGKHVLFVDSTVDSGRQIRALSEYFDHEDWHAQLGFQSWSVVGSNEYGQSLPNHFNVNWGVDPDQTFEDDPRLMGVDYAPGTHTKVIEVPSETSERIRQVILDVPAGFVFDLTDIDEQIAVQQEKQRAAKKIQRTVDQAINWWSRSTSTQTWWAACDNANSHLEDPADLDTGVLSGSSDQRPKLLVVGNGGAETFFPEQAAQMADLLGNRFTLMAGTEAGNPGLLLHKVVDRVEKPSVQLYQPAYDDECYYGPGEFGDNSICYVGPYKEDMRARMLQDADMVLVLGGRSGTLQEVMMAIMLQKPVVLISDWGAVSYYLQRSKSKKVTLSDRIYQCPTLAEAVRTLLMLAMR